MAAVVLLAAAAGAQNFTVPVGTVNEPVGVKSSAQTASVTITTAGTLSGITVLTEGVNNKDFQLSSYSCSPGARLTAAQVCTIGYTFQPQVAGLRRGGISLNDSNGNALGTAYIAGFGTGGQLAVYAGTNGLANPQNIISGTGLGQFAIDASGNIFYANFGAGGAGQIMKATPNASGIYTSTLVSTTTNNAGIYPPLQALALDGLGNVFYDDAYGGANSECAVSELHPLNSGYSHTYPIPDAYSYDDQGTGCTTLLAIDGGGNVYSFDNLAAELNVSKPTAGGYTSSPVAYTEDDNATDLTVDPERNLYWADGPGDQGDVYPDEVIPFIAASGAYSYNGSLDGMQVNFAFIQGGGPDPYDGDSQNYSVFPDNTGSLWMSEGTNVALTSGPNANYPGSAIFHLTPSGGVGNYNFQQFSTPLLYATNSIRIDAQGNMYFSDGNGSTGIYKISADPTLTFPSTISGTTSSPQDLILTNLGTSNLTVQSVSIPSFLASISAGGANGYADCNPGTTLAPGGMCIYRTEFTPSSSANGTVTGTVSIVTNAPSPDTNIAVTATASHPLPTITGISPAAGGSAGGTLVTITGTYLGGASAVHFNGTAATSVTQISPTEITAVSPAGTVGANATITVTNPGGTGSSAPGIWTWNPVASTATSSLVLADTSILQFETTTATVTLRSSSNAPIANDNVTFLSSNGAAVVSQQAITNASGVATVTLTGIDAGSTTITATVDGVAVRPGVVLTVTPIVVPTQTTSPGQIPPVGTVNEPVGTTSSTQTVTVTVTTAGVLSSIVLPTEGTDDLDFQLVSSSCALGASLTVNQSCTIRYTFQPRLAGLRRGGVTLNDSNGHPLGIAYLAGYGEGPQLAVYAGSGGLANPQQIISGTVSGQFSVDGQGNIFYATYDSNGTGTIMKATPNAGGSYTSTLVSSTSEVHGAYPTLQALAMDGLGNIFYNDSYYYTGPYPAGTACAIGQLTPQSGGYVQSDPIEYGALYDNYRCAAVLALDGAGTIYSFDVNRYELERETYAAGAYTSSDIEELSNLGETDLAVDAGHNVYVVDCSGDGQNGNSPLAIAPWDTATGMYDNGFFGPSGPIPYSGQQCGITPDSSSSLWMSDTTGYALGSGPFGNQYGAAIYHLVPSNGQFNYTTQAFSGALLNEIGSVRIDAEGNLYYDDALESNGLFKFSATPSLAFPSTTSGTASSPQDLMLTNIGNSSLSIQSVNVPSFITVVSANGANGYTDCAQGTTLMPGGMCIVRAEFTPSASASGAESGSIRIVTDAVDPDKVLTVTGTANHPLPTVTSISPAAGDAAGGTTVTIQGTYLGDATAVTFNAVPATSVTVISATQMTVVAPAGTPGSTATITVTNPGGTGSSASGAWTWNALPSATVSSALTLGSSSIMQSATTTVTATISSGANVPLANENVTFSSSNGAVVASAHVTTNASGVATATLRGLAPGVSTLSVVVDGVTSSSTATLTVTPAVVAVGTTLTNQTAQVVITKAGTLAGVFPLNKGMDGGDFNASGDTCSLGASLTVNQVCTITYSVDPTAPGLRQGAIVLLGTGNSVLGQTFVSAIGSGPQGVFTDGVASALTSTQDFIASVAIDDSGNVYYTDQTTESLYRMTSSGTVTTLASGMSAVTGVAVDGAGNVFYGDYGANQVYELVQGSGTPQSIASVSNPDIGMATDGAGNVYVSSPQHVVRIDALTHATSTVGSAAGYVPGVAVDALGNVYYTDTTNSLIYRTPAGSTTGAVIVSSGLVSPRGITVDAAGNLYVAEQGSQTLLRLQAGTYAPTTLSTAYGFNSVVLDRSGNLFATGSGDVIELNRTTASVSFPTIAVYASGPTETVQFENDGNSVLSISGYAASPAPFAAATSAGSCVTGGLATSDSCELAATFSPQSVATFTGNGTLTEASGATHVFSLAGSATVASQTISFVAPAMLTYPASSTLTATATSGLAVTFATSTPAVCTITGGGALTYVSAGTCIVAASQAGNGTYSAATPVSQSITLQPATQTITFPEAGNGVGYTGTTLQLSASASSGLAVRYTTNTSAYCTVDNLTAVLSFTTLGAGKPCVVTVNQSGNADYAAAPANSLTFPILESGPPSAPGRGAALGGDGQAVVTFTPSVTGNGYAVTGYTVTSSPGGIVASGAASPITVTGLTDGTTYTFTVKAQNAKGLSSASPVSNPVTPETAGSSQLWLVYANGTLQKIGEDGASVLSTFGSPASVSVKGDAAVGAGGGIWSVTAANNTVNYVAASGSGATSFSGGGLNAPVAVAVDGSGKVWVANSGAGSVSAFTPTGTALTPVAGYSTGGSGPTGIAIDAAGSVWTSNSSSGNVTRILGVAAPTVSPTASGLTNGTVATQP